MSDNIQPMCQICGFNTCSCECPTVELHKRICERDERIVALEAENEQRKAMMSSMEEHGKAAEARVRELEVENKRLQEIVRKYAARLDATNEREADIRSDAESRVRELEARLARIPNLIRFSLVKGGQFASYHMRSSRNGSWIDRDQLIAVINGTPDPWEDVPTGEDVPMGEEKPTP